MADQSSGAHDPFAFLKTFWAQMQLPGIGAGEKTAGFSAGDFMSPLFSAEKIDERLNQLKLVEGWLSLNLNILQMQIKTLEMQKAGLSAVRSAASAVGVGPAVFCQSCICACIRSIHAAGLRKGLAVG